MVTQMQPILSTFNWIHLYLGHLHPRIHYPNQPLTWKNTWSSFRPTDLAVTNLHSCPGKEEKEREKEGRRGTNELDAMSGESGRARAAAEYPVSQCSVSQWQRWPLSGLIRP